MDNKKYFAGIGSRSTPEDQIDVIDGIARLLVGLEFILRSGGATGADTFWENAYDKYGGMKEIYLPTENFNNNKSPLFGVSQEALQLVKEIHPAWDKLNGTGFILHARNGYQVLGPDLKTHSDFVVCWTEDGEVAGGTAQAIRIANRYEIPVFNLGTPQRRISFDNFLNLNYIL